ncbi:MAG: ABC transporter permease [Chloroflexi bacterium]|nr:ABC transporter permease [Chloroflexota bacterium]
MATQSVGRVAARTADPLAARAPRTFWGDAWRRFRKQKTSLVGLVIVTAVILMGIFAPVLAPADPDWIPGTGLRMGQPVPPGTPGFPLGADVVGRDVLSRIIFGARVSLMVATIANVFALMLGFVVGSVSAFFGGIIETILMRLTEMLLSIPGLLLALALSAFLSPSLGMVIVVITAIYWTYLARIVHGQVRSIKEKDFIEAAYCIGCTRMRILFRHVIPQLLGIAIVYSSLSAANMILTESTLSFLGIGVRPPTPSWGQMLSMGPQAFLVAPWIVIFPGIMVMVTVFGFNLVGDGLRDALDPRSWK